VQLLLPIACRDKGNKMLSIRNLSLGILAWMAVWVVSLPVADAQPYMWLQNRWKPEQFIHIETGAVQAGPIQPGWWSAMWNIRPAK
jgi:hypothetical protein